MARSVRALATKAGNKFNMWTPHNGKEEAAATNCSVTMLLPTTHTF